MNQLYILRTPKSQWGDYSSILIKGMSAHLGRKDGLIQLERTGPYIPPISFPGIGDIVVTDEFRRQLESSGLSGLRFQPIIKKHIAHLDWRRWDLSAKRPPEYPEDGEPESYILGRPHSPELSDQMGDLWELIGEALQGADFFRGQRTVLVSEKAKAWLLKHAGEHVRFMELEE